MRSDQAAEVLSQTDGARSTLFWALFQVALLCVYGQSTCRAEGSTPVATSPAVSHVFSLEDAFKLEHLQNPAIGPDGTMIAYECVRSLESARRQNAPPADWRHAEYRSDIWLVSLPNGKPWNLTQGETAGEGYFSPLWSPDGKRLALLSTKNGDRSLSIQGDATRIFVWDRDSNKMEFMPLDSVKENHAVTLPPYQWIDENRLLVIRHPKRKSVIGLVTDAHRVELLGRQDTASVLDCGRTVVSEDDLSPTELVLLDVRARSYRKVASIPRPLFRGLLLSPDRKYVAVTRLVSVNVSADKPLSLPKDREKGTNYCTEIYPLDQITASAPFVHVDCVVPGSFIWSLDASSFAVLVQDRSLGVEKHSREVVQGDPISGWRRVVLSDSMQPRQLFWATQKRLIMLAESRPIIEGKQHNQRDLWMLPDGAPPINLTTAATEDLEGWIPAAGGEKMLGLRDGNAWLFDLDLRALTKVPLAGDKAIAQWNHGADLSEIAVTTPPIRDEVFMSLKDDNACYRLNLKNGEIRKITPQVTDAQLVSIGPGGTFAVFKSIGTVQETMEVADLYGLQYRFAIVNPFEADLRLGKSMHFKYEGQDGQELDGWLILPVAFDANHRYPLVTVVYPGQVYSEVTPQQVSSFGNGAVGFWYLQLLASHGYAVLLPSMPLPNLSGGNDNYLELPKGVLPAVDAAIALGIADSKRLGIMGWSYGGYAVYGLLTQTSRFKAAIAGAGASDLTSIYGTFSWWDRYESVMPAWTFNQTVAEAGQMNLGAPPWADAGRYLRNSPLLYADRVRTPVLIVQGDEDFVPIQQGEEFFSALNRLGRRARFVRFWNEGHGIAAPANILKLWDEAFCWLDEFIGPNAKPSSASALPNASPVRPSNN